MNSDKVALLIGFTIKDLLTTYCKLKISRNKQMCGLWFVFKRLWSLIFVHMIMGGELGETWWLMGVYCRAVASMCAQKYVSTLRLSQEW